MNAFIKQTPRGYEVHTAPVSELFVTLNTIQEAEKVRITLEGGSVKGTVKRNPGRQPGTKIAPKAAVAAVAIDGLPKNKGGRPKGSGKKITPATPASKNGVNASILREAIAADA